MLKTLNMANLPGIKVQQVKLSCFVNSVLASVVFFWIFPICSRSTPRVQMLAQLKESIVQEWVPQVRPSVCIAAVLVTLARCSVACFEVPAVRPNPVYEQLPMVLRHARQPNADELFDVCSQLQTQAYGSYAPAGGYVGGGGRGGGYQGGGGGGRGGGGY